MSAQSTADGPTTRGLAGRVARTPLRTETYRHLAYLLVMFPLGTVYFTLLTTGFLTGVPLVVVGIGVPIVVACLALVVVLAAFERVLVRHLLDVEVPALPPETDGSLWTRTKRLVTSRETWTALVYLLAEFVYGTVVFGVLAGLAATAASLLLAPFYYSEAPVTVYGPIPNRTVTLDVLFGWDSLLVGLTTTFELGSWQVETFSGALLVAGLGVVVLVALLLFATVVARFWGRFARRMLRTPVYWSGPG